MPVTGGCMCGAVRYKTTGDSVGVIHCHTIKDEWIEDLETLGEKMDEYIDAQKEATGFDLRYTTTTAPSEKDWRDCSEVLSRRDFAQIMTTGWGERIADQVDRK